MALAGETLRSDIQMALASLWGGRAKSLVFALCENEAGALSANQHAVLQCKINSGEEEVSLIDMSICLYEL